MLSLRFCSSIDESVTEIIGTHASPFHLRELYLDGCEKINDAALLKLTKPKSPEVTPSKKTFKQLPAYIRDTLKAHSNLAERKVITRLS